NNSVDDIRSLIDQVRIPPQVGKYKVYIIDEVHMLSQSAFNAFLKTLEEPPKHAIFILATTEKHKIIPTILSRCQIFDFKRITVKDAAKYLKYIAEQQGIEAEDDALHIIAQKADGAMRDALSIFDRVVSFSGKNLTRAAVTENLNVLDYDTYFATTDLILEHNIPQLLVLYNQTLAKGFEGHHFISGLASHFRDLLVCRHEDTIALLEVGEKAKKQYLEQSKRTSESFLLTGIGMANECDLNYKASKNHRLLVELTLMKLASIDFNGEKKNLKNLNITGNIEVQLIPTSFFIDELPTKQSLETVKFLKNTQTVIPKEKEVEFREQGESTETEKADPQPLTAVMPEEVMISDPNKNIKIKERSKRISGLSLSSLKAKKEHQLKRIEVVIDEDELPKESFAKEELLKHWDSYIKKLEDAGKKIMASNLSSDQPKIVNESEIWIELPNGTMKKEIEREQYHLLKFLRKQLNNYSIELKITVNDEIAKKFAYTPEEKYQKLREINPAIDLLRKEFDLDL
ncbi:MAG: DNA polymerase III subunit gamma/tau, partial [Eudoraea sp.]|uniref:DNA polymerase III subunit gamma/tau n=1 Tax=Eudoraea sp. TaxID=1979955 RepID=UPI003C787B69